MHNAMAMLSSPNLASSAALQLPTAAGVPLVPSTTMQLAMQYDNPMWASGDGHVFTTQRLQAALCAGLAVQPSTVNYESLEERLQELFSDGLYGTAVSALYEYCQTRRLRVNLVQVARDGPDHNPRFTLVAVVDGQPFKRCEAGNKKKGKEGACFLAWTALIQEELEELKTKLSAEEDVGNQTALLVHIEYLRILLDNPRALCGRRAMAAIVMRWPKNKRGKVITLATGNKTVKAEHLGCEGRQVHDCHAEVLARRTFLRFLYDQAKLALNGSKEGIFQPHKPDKRKSSKLELRPGFTFHLYISTAPCGDAAVFTRASKPEEADATEPIYNNPQQGELRTKIEAGEGTIPIERPVQTWLSIKHGGSRLRTMSCSDKICKWIVIGLQGALLSYYIKPVYLTSVTVGTCYIYGHIARALYDRVTHPKAEPEEGQQLVPCPTPRQPILQHSQIEGNFTETEHSRNVGVSWCLDDVKAEIIDAQTGLCEPCMKKEESLVCKKQLFQRWLDVSLSRQQSGTLAKSYSEAKLLAKDYQKAKGAFGQRLNSNGYGTWLHYPLEVDLFTP